MMKHCDAEKPAFSLVKVSLTFVLLSFCNTVLFAQVAINGFARLTKTDISLAGKLQSANFNNDQFNDLLVISSTGKSVLTLQGKENGNFAASRKSSLSFIASATSMIDPKTNTIFIGSRSAKKGGIYQIKPDGSVQSLEQFSWRGAPSSIAAGDINDDGVVEYFIAGAGFQGISKLTKINNRHSESKIEKMLPFGAIGLADCNNDRHIDLVAYNISKQSLSIYYNNARGELTYTREVPIANPVKQILSTDLNLDGFTDIILVYTKGIEIIFGDGPASFSRRKQLFHREQIAELSYGDFNKDGIRDLAFTSELSQGVTIAFRTEAELFTPYTLLEGESVVSLQSFYSSYLEGLAIALENKILLLSTAPSLTLTEHLLFPIQPKFMTTFSGFNSGLSNLLLLDRENVGFVIRDNAGLPAVYNSKKLSAEYSTVLFGESGGGEREFYFWREGYRSFDKISLSAKGQNLMHQTLYTKGKIVDVSLANKLDDKGTNFLVLTESNDSYSLIGYSKQNKVTFSNTLPLSSKLLRRKIANSEQVYAFEERNDTLNIQLISVVGEKHSIKTLHLPKVKSHFLKTFGTTGVETFRTLVFADSTNNSVNLVTYSAGRFVHKKHNITHKVSAITSMICNAPMSTLLSLGKTIKILVNVKQKELLLTDISNIAGGTIAYSRLHEGERFPRTLVVYPREHGIGVRNR